MNLNLNLREQIRRQRELIFQMDEHYKKQLDTLHATIYRLEQNRCSRPDAPIVPVSILKQSGKFGIGVSLSALPPLNPPEFSQKLQFRRPAPSLTILPPL
jgi:hypothetical protein